MQPRRRPSGSSHSGTQDLSKAQSLTNSLVRGGDEGGGRSDEEGKEEEGTHLGKYFREGNGVIDTGIVHGERTMTSGEARQWR